jgi:hypothetical protein
VAGTRVADVSAEDPVAVPGEISLGGEAGIAQLSDGGNGTFVSRASSGASSLGPGGAEDGPKKRGRKSGQEVFGSDENIEVFNVYGKKLVQYCDDVGMADKRKVWFDRALMWVNHKMMGPLDDDPEVCDGRMLIETVVVKNRVVPFVSKRRPMVAV